MTIGEKIGENLACIVNNLQKEPYKIIGSEHNLPAIEYTCSDEKIANLCHIILGSAILIADQLKLHYRVDCESKKLTLSSYCSEDQIGKKFDTNYLSSLSSNINSYLNLISTGWSNYTINNNQNSIENELVHFEHLSKGLYMYSFFAILSSDLGIPSIAGGTKQKTPMIFVDCTQKKMDEIIKTIEIIKSIFNEKATI